MKIIHTSDWHLGKIIYEINLLEDQIYLLNQLLEQLDREKPDVLLISGDIYDRSVPNKEAVNALDYFLYEAVIIRKVKVIMISGNHDSADRIDFASRILTNNGLYIRGKLRNVVDKVVIEDEFGPVNFYLLPFSDVSTMRYIYQNEDIIDYDSGYKVILEEIVKTMNREERNILLAHGFIINLGEVNVEPDDSVRPLSVGNTEYVNVKYFEDFDYVALGHLHRPSKVLKETIRYSGSLMKYSFSEYNQKKGCIKIVMNEKGDTTTEFIDLVPLKDLKVVKSELKILLDTNNQLEINKNDYLKIVLTDENPVYDGFSLLKGIYPNILSMEYMNQTKRESFGLTINDVKKQRNDVELFKVFYEEMSEKEFTKPKEKIVTKILEELL